MPYDEFDKWFFSQKDFEYIFGKDFFLEFALMGSTNHYDIEKKRLMIERKIRDLSLISCECVALADLCYLSAGTEESSNVLSRLKEIKSYGEDKYWLYLYECDVCKQSWLVALEMRIDDVYYLKRLNNEEKEAIINFNEWPNYFFSYAEVLKNAPKLLPSRARFIDPYNSVSLLITLEILLKENNNISIQEIAELLGINLEVTKLILYKIKHPRISKIYDYMLKIRQLIKKIFYF
jgi:hypothetical protein